MGLFKKLFTTTLVASAAVGGYYIYKNKDKIQKNMRAKKQNISLDLEVFNQAYHDYQDALNKQAELEEKFKYHYDYVKYYELLKENYIKIQHDLLNAQAENKADLVIELEELKKAITKELEDGLFEYEKVNNELEINKENINSIDEEVSHNKKIYDSAKQNVESHGRKYLKGIEDPKKIEVEQEFKIFELDENEQIEDDSNLNIAVDRTQDSINKLLETIKK